jgi:2-keto-4-pentenoate hydratase/2-oxohepta-3-ene-1,7-dioic acid hydratase in catechol pathway
MIIGRRCGPGIATPSAEEAAKYIAGYVVCNDVSALDLEFDRGGQPFAFNLAWSKSYPSFAPIGPWMVISENFNPTDAAVTLRINGETVVASNTRNYLWTAWELLEYFAAVMVMEPGDVISCGNFPPTKVVWPGDLIEIEIEKIGTLRNPVADSPHETRYRVPKKVTDHAAEFKALRASESRISQ